MQDSLGKEPQPDWPVFLAALSLLVLICIPLFLFPQQSLVFLATTYDSASYALASSASTSLAGHRPPARWHRMFWAFMLALLPTGLLVGDSGSGRLRSLQTASLIVSVPLFVIFVVMAISLVRALREDEAETAAR